MLSGQGPGAEPGPAAQLRDESRETGGFRSRLIVANIPMCSYFENNDAVSW